ncbi:E3 ubiquitin-protein ligase SIRP1-like [Syzygium oleosum]|uniref:E3 ubiquitin-protein ligase SIRP1-like n=1 Tax=Syzygium oleosum TaxID=219896 RepID=UPI0011D1F780|nr:E3 ubiquitin-protein ligase SIRP1-like [Syzygium oleosum]
MEEAMVARYWCHVCSRTVNPIPEAEIKWPYCESGFIEEMSSTTRDTRDSDGDFGSDRALSLWAPILLGMMGDNHRRRRFRRLGFEDEDDDTEEGESHHGVDAEFDREIESIIRRRRRSSATILRLLRDARAGIASESENGDTADGSRNGNDTGERESESARGSVEEGEGNRRNENGRRFSFPWPFSGLFSSNSGSHSGGGNSTSSPSGSSSNEREGASF